MANLDQCIVDIYSLACDHDTDADDRCEQIADIAESAIEHMGDHAPLTTIQTWGAEDPTKSGRR